MNNSGLIISEASELAAQLTSLLELLFERGSASGLPVNDNVIAIAYNMASKVSVFLMEEEKEQDEKEAGNAKHC
ncbi:hypothetical protein [Pantoea dispersa]|uniref:hypothetical protein n=1 Tax=Pantoea dispersa TaxID=59814 RepID=UPI000FD75E57|nr:hypothetical protein [Pantoea dispersa]MDR6298244.1 hypothetical protein [Pantoea dispersa]RVU75175.1 hypothetical protein EKH82_11850 [Pantoea dispersa]